MMVCSVGDPDPEPDVFGLPDTDSDPSLSHKGVGQTEIMLAK
jgi:hypothetical protein